MHRVLCVLTNEERQRHSAWSMMTSSNGNIFRVTGHLCGQIHRSPVYSPHKVQWSGALVFSSIYAWINGWVNTGEAGDLRRHCPHYDVTVMDWGRWRMICDIWTPEVPQNFTISRPPFWIMVPRLQRQHAWKYQWTKSSKNIIIRFQSAPKIWRCNITRYCIRLVHNHMF